MKTQGINSVGGGAVPHKLTQARREALEWLTEHNGDGMFDRTGVLLAGGERAPVIRSTWNKLEASGHVEFYRPVGSRRGRLRITDLGMKAVAE